MTERFAQPAFSASLAGDDMMLASPTQPANISTPFCPQTTNGQLQFNWEEQPSIGVVASAGAETVPSSPAPKPFTIDGPSERRIRKMKRISIGREPRPIPGGEAWESPKKTAPAQQPRVSPARPALAVETSHRFAEPVRIGAAMLNLLCSYGITEEEIAAGLASYAGANSHAVAS